MTPDRLRQIARQIYRPSRPSDYAFRTLLAADLRKSVSAVKGWLAEPGTIGHRNIPAQTAALLERAFTEADRLKLWERPEGETQGLLIQRL